MSLYQALKDDLIKHILTGKYAEGEVLPTEQALGEQHGLSRVTVRKALEELKREGLVTSVQGQGTVVSTLKGGNRSSMDIIALVAQVHNPFFASFMEHFESAAEAYGSLVLFKQDFHGDTQHSEQLFFRFLSKEIRNVVFWPHGETLDLAFLRRLRLTGMNLVLFDQMFDTDVADVVSVDNEHAVRTLYEDQRAQHQQPIIYIGYHGTNPPSEMLRRQAFVQAGGLEHQIYTVLRGGDVEAETAAHLERMIALDPLHRPHGVICCNGPIGLAAARFMAKLAPEQQMMLSTIDYLPEMEQFKLRVYDQPMKALAETAYQRLVAQNNQGNAWTAKSYLLPGELLKLEP